MPDRLVCFILVAALGFGCDSEPLVGAPVDGSATDIESGVDVDASTEVIESLIDGRPCPTDNETTYDNTGGPFLLTWCVGCHSSHVPSDQRQGAPLGVDFDTVADIEAWLLRIYARAADDNNTMPPADPVTEAERWRLGDWIACGAPGLESAVLPEPGDGMPIGGSGGGTGRGTGGSGNQVSCESDTDCEDACPGALLGCACTEKPQGMVCVRICEADSDCPDLPSGFKLTCGADGFCGM